MILYIHKQCFVFFFYNYLKDYANAANNLLHSRTKITFHIWNFTVSIRLKQTIHQTMLLFVQTAIEKYIV